MRKITGAAVVMMITGLLTQTKAQDFRPGRVNSIRLSQSFIRAESDFSMLTVLGYRYQFIEKIRIAGDLGYQGCSYSGNKVNEFTFAAGTDFTYSQGRTVEFYGTVSAGYSIHTGKIDYPDKPVNEKRKDADKIIYQINPIAMRVGNSRISGFAELGWGYRGLVTAGAAFKF
ncbi:hypothetical protein HDF26_004407 [Pedobacter cryoconitis]|uniref:hypothetical protein n=1 Tax=Pedobacter cryoconitis TaxID=188932 RepID=UPI00161FE2D3|nr:hypothetical protein [Pedobacter cryoconitis]MBB6273934.1 hypothetical protein [Pedobacter cryoconitis]